MHDAGAVEKGVELERQHCVAIFPLIHIGGGDEELHEPGDIVVNGVDCKEVDHVAGRSMARWPACRCNRRAKHICTLSCILFWTDTEGYTRARRQSKISY